VQLAYDRSGHPTTPTRQRVSLPNCNNRAKKLSQKNAPALCSPRVGLPLHSGAGTLHARLGDSVQQGAWAFAVKKAQGLSQNL